MTYSPRSTRRSPRAKPKPGRRASSAGLLNLEPKSSGELRRLRDDADQVRFQWMHSFREGKVTVGDILQAALSPEGVALRKIKVADLFGRTVKGQQRFTRFMNLMFVRRRQRHTRPPVEPTLSWLVHPQASPERIMLLQECLADNRDYMPWPGWPFTPDPNADERMWD